MIHSLASLCYEARNGGDNGRRSPIYDAPYFLSDLIDHHALSSLYYLRTRVDFIVGKAIIIQVYDSGKNIK
jgi:hypothetical protein